MRLTRLKCDHCVNPLGIDNPTPSLSYEIESQRNGFSQTGRQILVASTEALLGKDVGDCWDSGIVESSHSQQIAYAGKPLTPKTRYFWKVRIKNEQGKLTEWSDVSWFESAMFGESGWSSPWISAPDSYLSSLESIPKGEIPMGEWIVPSFVSRMYIRRDILLNEHPVNQVIIQVQCDNPFILFINNQQVELPAADSPMHIPPLDVSVYLDDRKLNIAILAFQTGKKECIISAVRAGVVIEYSNGEACSIVSDRSWKCGDPIELVEKHLGQLNGWFKSVDPLNWQTQDLVYPYWRIPSFCHSIHPRLYRRSCYFRKQFSLPESIKTARIYIAAYGSYQPYINGKRVGRELLIPGHNEKYLEYQTYDVTEYIRQGNNVVGFISGNGWEGGYWYTLNHFTKPSLRIQLEIVDIEDRLHLIKSDHNWLVHASPILENYIAWGERYDANQEIRDWLSSKLETHTWKNAEETVPYRLKTKLVKEPFSEDTPPLEELLEETPILLAEPCEPVRITGEYLARSIKQLGPDRWLFDFGQNVGGRCQLKLPASEATESVIIRYDETLGENGEPRYDKNLFNMAHYPDDNQPDGPSPYLTKNADYYVPATGRPCEWMPRYCYTGFQYAELIGFRGSVEEDTLKQIVFHSDLPETGSFECDNPLLLKIGEVAKRTFRGNLYSGPAESSTREKANWLGDVHFRLPATIWYMDSYRLYSKWMTGGPKWGEGPGWDDSNILVPWVLYQYYGKREVLESNYPRMKSIVDYRLKHTEDNLYLCKERHCWSDHMAVDKVSTDFFSAAHYVYALKVMGQIAEILELDDDMRCFSTHYQKAFDAFNKKYLDSQTGTYGEGYMASQTIPLGLGLVPQREIPAVMNRLVQVLKETDYTSTGGFFGTHYLMGALTEHGHPEVAYQVITQTISPSWGYMIENGATTFAEGLSGCGSKSLSAFGSVCSWFFEYLAGIQPDSQYSGFKHFRLKPFIPSKLNYVNAEYPSPYGMIKSMWKKKEGEIIWNVTIPPNTQALVSFPCHAIAKIKEGQHPLTDAQYIADIRQTSERIECRVPSGNYTFYWPAS